MAVPKGKIVAIGGNEDKGSVPVLPEENLRKQVRFFENGILKRIPTTCRHKPANRSAWSIG